jgi:hypothetical protein
MKTFLRVTWRAAVLAVVLGLTTGCPDKLKNLKAKADEAERELRALQTGKSDIQLKIDKIARWEAETPPRTNAIQQQQIEIAREQGDLEQEHAKMLAKLDEMIKEFKEINDVELGEVVSYLTNALPLLKGLLLMKYPALTNALNLLSQSTPQKLEQLESLQDQQVAVVQSLATLPPGPGRDAALDQLNLLLVQGSQISFQPEIDAAGFLSAQLGAVGPLPVLAGSFVPQTTVVLEEGLPSTLSHLDSGVLALGTEVLFQLPQDWAITAPVTAVSSNLVLQLQGNVAGTNAFKILVVGELTPGLTNNSITVIFNGIRIGQTPGHASSCVFVNPGRAQDVEFCVFPDPPPVFNLPSRVPGGMGLSWQGRGTLQRSAAVQGPYSPAPDQANPQVVPVTNTTEFFRISRP